MKNAFTKTLKLFFIVAILCVVFIGLIFVMKSKKGAKIEVTLNPTQLTQLIETSMSELEGLIDHFCEELNDEQEKNIRDAFKNMKDVKGLYNHNEMVPQTQNNDLLIRHLFNLSDLIYKYVKDIANDRIISIGSSLIEKLSVIEEYVRQMYEVNTK